MGGEILYKAPGRRLDETFRTGVSLHGHTLHSIERMWFFRALAERNAIVRWLMAAHYRSRSDSISLDHELSRMWWTPPLSAAQALALEAGQIERELCMQALVSLTDHDNINGWTELEHGEAKHIPISMEWSVSYEGMIIHLGVHNLPPRSARPLVDRMSATGAPVGSPAFEELLQALSDEPGLLLVLNHPLWDLAGIGAAEQERRVTRFIRQQAGRIHALEINGMRPYEENRRVLALSRAISLPLVSGGDRHGVEPSAILNVTNAATFPEFVDEIRRDHHSRILVMPQYREPHVRRLLQSMREVLDDYPDHPRGWVHWSQRCFRLRQNDLPRDFAEMFKRKGQPLAMKCFVAGVNACTNHRLQAVLRLASAGEQPRFPQGAARGVEDPPGWAN